MTKEEILLHYQNTVTRSELLYVFKMLYDLGKITEIEYEKAIIEANKFED
ncbi:hypothetical protein [Anaerotignum sp.]